MMISAEQDAGFLAITRSRQPVYWKLNGERSIDLIRPEVPPFAHLAAEPGFQFCHDPCFQVRRIG